MGWRVFGDTLYTADIGAQNKFQKFKLNSNKLLLAVRTWFIFYNNPTLTSLKAEIWSDSNGVPGTKLHTSNSLTKAQMITLSNGIKEVYFEFNPDYGVSIHGQSYYHIVINGSGYTGNDSAHVAWMKDWPDQLYSDFYTPTTGNFAVGPFKLTFIGADPT